ncbi:MAG: hypothetical protein H7Y59_00360 [Anaerolineales bacterium]|nr:hypothetical protein [Anaerolineales bacterium]
MFGLTMLGVFHTAIGLVALGYGFWSLVRYKQISPRNRIGQIYILTTFVTAVTSLGIYQRGGFGPQHILGILTVIGLAVGTLSGNSTIFGRASQYVQAISFSSTIFFHLLPAAFETWTRLPPEKPLVASPSEPVLKIIILVLTVVFLVGVTLQITWLRASSRLANQD